VQLDETWNGNPSGPDDWERVRKQAHDLVSAAGLLGFSSLSLASRELTSILRADGAGTRRALEALDIARMEQGAVSEFLQARLHAIPSGAA
jgi:HPt (histidine-containing phosphotransfer) domain-containing protein